MGHGRATGGTLFPLGRAGSIVALHTLLAKIFDFTYKLDGSTVVQTDTRRSDGTWTQYTFSKTGFTTSETWGREGSEPATFAYERDPTTNAVVSLSLTCPDRTGRQLRHSSLVRPGREEWIKWDLARTHCSWSGRRWRSAG